MGVTARTCVNCLGSSRQSKCPARDLDLVRREEGAAEDQHAEKNKHPEHHRLLEPAFKEILTEKFVDNQS